MGLIRHTRLAHHISIPQLRLLIHPITITPTNIELDKMMREMNTGAKSLHRRSIRRVTALRCVSVYDDCFGVLVGGSSLPLPEDCGCTVPVVLVARMGTHSRSMAIIFPIPLRFSHIPNPITIANIHVLILLSDSASILFLLFGAGTELLRSK